MYQVTRTIISNIGSQAELYHYSDCYGHLAKNLYNAALFRVRQRYTGFDKTEPTDNEKTVADEINLLMKKYPKLKVGRYITYIQLEKLMRVTNNPDYFAGLSMQTAQLILKTAVNDFRTWRKSLTAYYKNPSNFLGKPKMPGYKKKDVCTYTISNQDGVFYPSTKNDGVSLKLPKTSIRMALPQVKKQDLFDGDGKPIEGVGLKEVKVIPYYGRYIISCTIELPDVKKPNIPDSEVCAIDFGVTNFAAIVCTDGSSRLYKGGAVLSDIQWFSKQRAKYVGILTRGHDPKYCKKSSRMLENISFKHGNFSTDQLHKISRSIVDYCIAHKVDMLVLGSNPLWKQESNLGKQNNQNFVSMPIARLREMIIYKAEMAGISVMEQEESYTSKADITANDFIPVYGTDGAEAATFSGRRIGRGLYQCADGTVINADCNGAANIMRKAIPGVWGDRTDWTFLSTPEVYGFHQLNPTSNPVKRIAG